MPIITERVCRYGLRHLIGNDYVWSPERGRYRLTHRGRAIVVEVIADTGRPAEGSDGTSPQGHTEAHRRRHFGRRY